jgi:hypothetical protein
MLQIPEVHMKRNGVLAGLSAILTVILVSAAPPAAADLIFNPAANTAGTGLGAVQTLVTLQDGSGKPGSLGNNGLESGCVSYNPASPSSPTFGCLAGLQGGDNQAINKTYILSNVTDLAAAGDLAAVVNIDEPGNDDQAVLTDLYLALFNVGSPAAIATFSFMGGPMTLSETGGIGNSGFYRFTLDATQALQADLLCPVLANCVVGGGVQLLAGSTSGGPETMYLQSSSNAVPEPPALSLLALGLLGLGFARRARTPG